MDNPNPAALANPVRGCVSASKSHVYGRPCIALWRLFRSRPARRRSEAGSVRLRDCFTRELTQGARHRCGSIGGWRAVRRVVGRWPGAVTEGSVVLKARVLSIRAERAYGADLNSCAITATQYATLRLTLSRSSSSMPLRLRVERVNTFRGDNLK